MTDIEIGIQAGKINAQTEKILNTLRDKGCFSSWRIKGNSLVVSTKDK